MSLTVLLISISNIQSHLPYFFLNCVKVQNHPSLKTNFKSVRLSFRRENTRLIENCICNFEQGLYILFMESTMK